MESVKIRDIIDRGYCLGCGLCVSILGNDKLKIIENHQGFLVPELSNDKKLAYLRNLCPGITVKQLETKNGIHKIYGPFKAVAVGFSTDNRIRAKASSGGLITALLCYLLDKSLVDGVLHVGKDTLDPLKSVACFSRTKDEVIDRSGSRYAPTSLLTGLIEILSKENKIAVVGKPCDIVAVRAFLKENPKYRNQIVLMISFMCMGMPSYNGTRSLVKTLGCKIGKIKDFWYRGNGWPGKTTAIDESGCMHSCLYEESWGKILSKLINFRCKICPDGYGEFADLSCADAWYLKDEAPSFEETDGRSFIFVRTEQGESIYKQAINDGYIKTEGFDINKLRFTQPSQYYRKNVVGARILALKIMGDRLLNFTGFNFCSNLKNVRFRQIVRNFLGMCKRRFIQILHSDFR
jgi:coenzyme F420 hydrogenase subunit beta